MTGRSGSVTLASPVLAAVLLAGCVGVASLEETCVPAVRAAEIGGDTDALAPANAGDVLLATEPDIGSFVPRALPSLIQSIHANGVVWCGYNVQTAQSGDLNEYDGGEGWSLGFAFGNGEDVKRFVELAFEETRFHDTRDSPGGTIIRRTTQNHFYVGARRYLLPVTGVRSRVAPFVVGGICYNEMSIAGGGGADLSSAAGMGLYVGTGVELYFGAQLAMCMDMRVAYWNWEGIPVDTGYQSNGGGAVSLVYHF